MKVEKKDKAINTRVSVSTWEWLISLGGSAGGAVKAIIHEAEQASKDGVHPYRIAQYLSELQAIRKRSENELRGKFTPAEWSLMADALNGTATMPDFRCISFALIASVEDSDKYDGLGAKWEVDINLLVEKIDKLTAAQVDAVFTRVEEFWNSPDKDLEKWSNW